MRAAHQTRLEIQRTGVADDDARRVSISIAIGTIVNEFYNNEQNEDMSQYDRKFLDRSDRLFAVCYNYAADLSNEHKAPCDIKRRPFPQSKKGGNQLFEYMIKHRLGSKPHPTWSKRCDNMELHIDQKMELRFSIVWYTFFISNLPRHLMPELLVTRNVLHLQIYVLF
jgi:hypothetical protein